MQAQMLTRCRRAALPVATIAAGFLLAVACVTPTSEPVLPPPPPPPPELDLTQTCQVLADVEDAEARADLVTARHRWERTAHADPHAALAVILTQPTPEQRFRASTDRRETAPTSVVGPYAACVVYAGWSRMGEMAARSCAEVRDALGASSALVDLALAESALVHQQDAAAAQAALAPILAAAPTCTYAHLLKARAEAMGSPRAQRDAWQKAAEATRRQDGTDACFVCLVEQAKAEEQLEPGPAGRARAAALWERALRLAPEHPETLRRFGAMVVGVDDARAYAAYRGAVDAGSKDVPTVLAAARLAVELSTTPAARAEAVRYATRAVELARDDPEAHRLRLRALVAASGDDATVASEKAAREEGDALLALSPDDVVAHAALARLAMQKGPLHEAVLHYHALAGLLGDEEARARLGEAETTALQAEWSGLLKKLQVDEQPLSGSPNVIARGTQRGLQALWRTTIRADGVKKGGALQVVVETNAEGQAVSVELATDDAGNAEATAATKAWLLRAQWPKAARRYTLDFLLQ